MNQENIYGATNSNSNNSTQPLDNGETFTGAWEYNDASDVMVFVKTDQNGTIYCDFSPDGSNVDSTLSFVYDTTRINPPHILVKASRYFRVRFTNDSGSNQTYLRLDCSFGSFNKLTAPINGTLSENYDATVVRPTDYYSEVAMGKRQGRTVVNKWGVNNDVDTGTEEVVSSWGGAFDPSTDVMTTAQTFTITYSNASDGSTQSGARSLLITYIDENYKSQTATHTLGSSGSDITSFTGFGINRAVVLSNGGAGWNVQNITITATSDGTTQAQIPSLASVTQQMIYHTQINHTLLADWLFLNALKIGGGSNPIVTFKIYSWSRVTETRYKVFEYRIDTADKESIELKPSQKFAFGGREVIWITATTTVDNTQVTARLSGIEERVS